MVNFTDMDSKESVGVEQVKEELAKARVELGRKRREGGAVTRSSWGEPGASPTPWTPKPLPAGDERLLEEQVEGEGWGWEGTFFAVFFAFGINIIF